MDPRNTHDIGRLYWHVDTRTKSFRPAQISRAQMVEEPFRRGIGFFLSVPGLRCGLVIGYWGRREVHRNPDAQNWWFNQNLPVGVRIVGDATEEVREWDV